MHENKKQTLALLHSAVWKRKSLTKWMKLHKFSWRKLANIIHISLLFYAKKSLTFLSYSIPFVIHRWAKKVFLRSKKEKKCPAKNRQTNFEIKKKYL